jgi:hypothetical protein
MAELATLAGRGGADIEQQGRGNTLACAHLCRASARPTAAGGGLAMRWNGNGSSGSPAASQQGRRG